MVPSACRQVEEDRHREHQGVAEHEQPGVEARPEHIGEDRDHGMSARQVRPGQKGEDGKADTGLDQFIVAQHRAQPGPAQRAADDTDHDQHDDRRRARGRRQSPRPWPARQRTGRPMSIVHFQRLLPSSMIAVISLSGKAIFYVRLYNPRIIFLTHRAGSGEVRLALFEEGAQPLIGVSARLAQRGSKALGVESILGGHLGDARDRLDDQVVDRRRNSARSDRPVRTPWPARRRPAPDSARGPGAPPPRRS